jgi:hypothetical protein
MFKKIIYTLGLAILLSSTPLLAESQVTDSVKSKTTRTYKKAKMKTRHAVSKIKGTTKKEYNKTKNRIKSDDTKRDNDERK